MDPVEKILGKKIKSDFFGKDLLVGATTSSMSTPLVMKTQPMQKQIYAKPVATPVQMGNPAAVFAKQQGLGYTIVTNKDGSQAGYVILPNGQKMDEWAYYRQNYNPAPVKVPPVPVTKVAPKPVPKSIIFNSRIGRIRDII